MKKLIALLLALILVFSFVACKKEKPATTPDAQNQNAEGTGEEKAEGSEEVMDEDVAIFPEDFVLDTPIVTPDGEVIEVEDFINEGEEEENAEEIPAQQPVTPTLAVLQAIWSLYGEEEKFAVIGGNMEANIMDQPGSWDLAYKDGLSTTLVIPAEQLANVTEVATMVHMMNGNTFSGGVVKLADGVDAAAFAQAVRDAIQNNQWLCGMPEKLIISDLGEGKILIAFGLNDAMTVFEAKLAVAVADAQSLYNEAIGG